MHKKEAAYYRRKEEIGNDKSICKDNRDLFLKFLDQHEVRLKRKNGLRALDEGTYSTLYDYTVKLRIVNDWFNNKAWKDLTKKDIERVYNAVEDGKIVRKNGEPYRDAESSYYNKILRSKPFEMIGKADIAREVIESPNKDKEVRFITEDDFLKLIEYAYKPHHKLLLWLAFDIGENINSLLKLKKGDCQRQQNPHTNEMEYRINLPKSILKRARKTRSEITNHPETATLLDTYLKGLGEDDLLFNFGYNTAKKVIDRCSTYSKVVCKPKGQKVTWKDLRSSMACNLLKKGWTTDEINARLGHRPSSAEIDVYVDFLAIDRHRPKKKVQEYEIQRLMQEVKELKEREKLQAVRNDRLEEQIAQVKELVLNQAKGKIMKKLP